MRFPYRRYTVRGTAPNSYALVFRPMISVRVVGQQGEEDLLGRVDTGADDTLLPDHLIVGLGVPDLSGHVLITGIGGAILARYGTVDLEISQGPDAFRWSAYVGFVPHPLPVFGLKGFLRFFTSTFNGRRHHLDLIPNGTAPPASYPVP